MFANANWAVSAAILSHNVVQARATRLLNRPTSPPSSTAAFTSTPGSESYNVMADAVDLSLFAE